MREKVRYLFSCPVEGFAGRAEREGLHSAPGFSIFRNHGDAIRQRSCRCRPSPLFYPKDTDIHGTGVP